MSDKPGDKPKGLDLSKLLKKQPAKDEAAKPAVGAQVEVSSSDAPPPPEAKGEDKGGLSKLLAKAKAKSTEAPTAEKAPEKAPEPKPVEKAPPPKPIAPGAPPPRPTATKPNAHATNPGEITGSSDSLNILLGKASAPPEQPAKATKPAPKPVAKPPPKPTEKVAEKKPEAPKPEEKRATGADIVVPTDAAGRVAQTSGVDTTHATTAFASSVEDVASRSGAKRLAFDFVVGDARRYPRGTFGVDELFTQVLDFTNTCRRHAFRIPQHYRSGFSVHMETTGTILYKASIVWDGQDIRLVSGEHVGTAVVKSWADADSGIDLLRGKLNCPLVSYMGLTKNEGDVFLLYCLGLRKNGATNAAYRQQMFEEAEDEFERVKTIRKESKDAIDYFCKMVERQCSHHASRVLEPLFIRVTFETSPPVEVLIHVEAGRLTVMRGKPGESLLAGAAELRFSERAMRVYFEGEAGLFFLCRSGLVTVSGDSNVLPFLGLVTKDGVKILQTIAKTGQLVAPENPLYFPLNNKTVVDPLGEEFRIP
ncbi:MAG: hypothetical protein IT381_22900 [Deltaproteobacteria bacterium]|nr:hypothetical protein [Deltaproteobacteria bacterium]